MENCVFKHEKPEKSSDMETLNKQLIIHEHELKILKLKKEILELKEKQHAKEAEIHPNDYQFDYEYIVKTEVKEEVVDQDSMTIKEETNDNLIPKMEINPEDFQFQNESTVLLANADGTMTIKEEINE